MADRIWYEGRWRTPEQIQGCKRRKAEYNEREKLIKQGVLSRADWERQKDTKRLEQQHVREMRKPGYMRKPWEIVGWTQDGYHKWFKKLVKQYAIKG